MNMKRWLTAMLALILTLTQTSAGLISALAEEVEETAPEPYVELAGEIDAEGLTIELGDLAEEEEITPEAGIEAFVEEAPVAADNGDAAYAKAAAKASVRKAPEGGEIAQIASSGTVLVLLRDGEWTKVAFDSARGVVEGYIATEALSALSDDEISAFMDKVAADGDAVLYGGNLDAPLAFVECTFADEEKTGDDEKDIIDVEEPGDEATEEATTEAGDARIIIGEEADDSFTLAESQLVVPITGTATIQALDANGNAIAASKLSFKSGSTSIATVSAKGVVKGVKAGSATITVTYKENSVTCAVTVPQEPTKIAFNYSTGTMGVGDTFSGLIVKTTPANSTTTITWSSSNTKYVTVDANGVLKAIKAGSATITAKTRNGKKATCRVTVKKAPTSLTVSPATLKLGYGGSTEKLSYKVASGTACNDVSWSSSNIKVAIVDETGLVTSVGEGTATITATAYNGVTGTCKVTVCGAPASVKFSKKTVNVGTGENVTLSAAPYDANGAETLAAITYAVDKSSADPKCVTVNETTGVVTGVSAGTAVIRASAANGVSATCTVKVVATASAIKLNYTTGLMGVGQTFEDLIATPVTANGDECDTTITWSSSNTKVVTVNASGVLKAVKAGTATITAATSNGKKATCKVTVKKAPTKVTLSPTTLKLGAGGMTGTLKATLPSGSAGGVTFSSSNIKVATVDDKGVVTAVKEGTATITATTHNGKTATCKVSVLGEPGKVALGSSAMSVSIGDKATLKAEAFTAAGNETSTTLTYYIESDSPDPGCVKIDANSGAITALSRGVAYVNAKTHNGISAAAPCVVTVNAKPKSVSLPSKYAMGVGQTDTLEAIVTYQDGTQAVGSGLTWSTSSKSVVSVDASTGAMKALKTGSATITAKTSTGLKDTCKVTVYKAPTSMTINPSSVKLSAGGMKFQLGVTVSSGSAGDVTFTSSNESVVTIGDDGVLTTGNAGKATITGTLYNGLTATCAVTVTGKPATASFATTKLTLAASDSFTPDVNVKAADGSAAVADLTFRILSGPQYIDLDTSTGRITGVAAGTSVVGVTTHNGISASNTCTVTVVAAPTRVTLSDTSAALGVDETLSLRATVKAPTGADTSVTWSSSDSKVASVNSKGKVTALSTGSATITVSTVNNLTATCKVTVYKAPTSISLSPATGSLTVGESGQYTVKLSSGSAGTVTFDSSDYDIADIDDEGVVTGISVGTVTITATTYNGKKATAKLTIKKKGSSGGSGGGDDDEDYDYDADIEAVIGLAESQLGMPYIYGAGYKTENPRGFDCSGLVYWCYYYGANIKLKDSSGGQGSDDRYEKITSISSLRRGDVVCFKSDSGSTTSHTAIYLGGREFIHASSAGGEVIITSIDKDYYTRNFLWGRRIIE